MRKKYTPPNAELITFFPFERIAASDSWSWIWGTANSFQETPSVTGNLTIYGPEGDAWNTDQREDKPY